MSFLQRYAIIFGVMFCFAPVQNAQALNNWVSAWGTSASYSCAANCLQGYSLRTTVRLSAGGSQVRVRLSNEMTTSPTTLTSVYIATPGSTVGTISPSTSVSVTFSGSTSVTIPASGSVLSDPITMTVKALSSLTVSLYVSSAPAGISYHEDSIVTCAVASGNQTTAATMPGASSLVEVGILSGVDVLAASPSGTIVTLGDSITAGYASTANAFHSWPDYLVSLLQANSSLANLSVVNESIPGNRLLLDDIGPSALSRFTRDVSSQPGLSYITVMLGTNDIGYPYALGTSTYGPEVTAAQLEAGYLQIIAKGHELGAKVLLATITPFGGSAYYSTATETIRQAVNTWIRATSTSGADGVLDFDAAIRNPSSTTAILPAYDSGDHVHPNDAGYSAMANSINLSLF